ncbi:MAG: hypothetical protein R2706_17380 [Acidimicrobiales bacterium]
MPNLTGKKVVVFCTYAVKAGKTLEMLEAAATKLGGGYSAASRFGATTSTMALASWSTDSQTHSPANRWGTSRS